MEEVLKQAEEEYLAVERQRLEAEREFERHQLEAEREFERHQLEAEREFEQQQLAAVREFERRQLAVERQRLEVVGLWKKRRKTFLAAKAALDLAEGYQISPAHNLPGPLAEHVLEFIFNDPNTLASWVQSCLRNHTLCLDKLTTLKVWWEQLKGLGRAGKQVFHAKLTKTETLNLCGNGCRNHNIGDEGATALAPALAQLTRLKVLGLACNDIGDAGAAALAPALAQMTGLERCGLSNNEIGDAGAAALAPALAQMTGLTNLHLNRNHNIGDEGATALAPALAQMTRLKWLDLAYNDIGDAGAAALAPALAQMTRLNELDLESNKIGDAGAAALAPALAQMTGLERLDFERNRLGSEGAAALATEWEEAGKDWRELYLRPRLKTRAVKRYDFFQNSQTAF